MSERRRRVFEPEGRRFRDAATGASVRQITSHRSIHHHPFFLVPAYDDAMRGLVFVSHRSGRPEVFREERSSGRLIQLTSHEGLRPWSIHPSHDGHSVYYTAGSAGYRVDTETQAVEMVMDFGDAYMREDLMVAAGMGTTALSRCDRWWSVKFNRGGSAQLAIIDTSDGTWDVIVERDTIAHMQFCPDDAELLFYAGPFTDRIWTVRRDGSAHRRHHHRARGQWITHETWVPGRREIAFVDWPHGVRAVHVDSGELRSLTSFNAWHAVADRSGRKMVADTTFPDRGIMTFDVMGEDAVPEPLCESLATNVGDHWGGPFPYENGPIQVHAPQHTHPHPSFSPDGCRVVFGSDRSGFAQVYEVEVPSGCASSPSPLREHDPA
jgi:oligogalacturonide lyase